MGMLWRAFSLSLLLLSQDCLIMAAYVDKVKSTHQQMHTHKPLTQIASALRKVQLLSEVEAQTLLGTGWTTSPDPTIAAATADGLEQPRHPPSVVRTHNLTPPSEREKLQDTSTLQTHAKTGSTLSVVQQSSPFIFVALFFQVVFQLLKERAPLFWDFDNSSHQSTQIWHPNYLSEDSSAGSAGGGGDGEAPRTLPSIKTSNERSAESRGVSVLNEALSAPGVFLLWTAMFLFGLGHNVSNSNPSAPTTMAGAGPLQVGKKLTLSSSGPEGSRGTEGNSSTQASSTLGVFFLGFAVIQILLAFLFGGAGNKYHTMAVAAFQYLTGVAVSNYIAADGVQQEGEGEGEGEERYNPLADTQEH